MGETKEIDPLAKARADIIEDMDFLSSRISETSRYIGFGVLAVFYTVSTGDSDFIQRFRRIHEFWLYVMAVAGATTIIADYLQYLCGERASKRAFARTDCYLYDKTWLSYRLRAFFYRAKQVMAIIAATAILIISMRSFSLFT